MAKQWIGLHGGGQGFDSPAVHQPKDALPTELAVRFHNLRHTHASQLLAKRVHAEIVSERLGHASVGITLDTYSHLLPGLQEEAVRQLEASLAVTLAGVC